MTEKPEYSYFRNQCQCYNHMIYLHLRPSRHHCAYRYYLAAARDCVTHGRPLKNAAVRNNRLSLPHRLVRLLCALAVAMVTTFHVCDALDGKVVELVSVSDKTNGDAGKKPVGSLAAIEKCHVCAVVSIPGMAKADLPDSMMRIVPDGADLTVSPFDQPIIGPPPRA